VQKRFKRFRALHFDLKKLKIQVKLEMRKLRTVATRAGDNKPGQHRDARVGKPPTSATCGPGAPLLAEASQVSRFGESRWQRRLVVIALWITPPNQQSLPPLPACVAIVSVDAKTCVA
jgi:hypothetical protein